MDRYTQTLLTYTTNPASIQYIYIYSTGLFERWKSVSVAQVCMCISGSTCTLSSFVFCWFSKERRSLSDESCSHSCCSLVFFTCICSSSLVDRSFKICHSQRRDEVCNEILFIKHTIPWTLVWQCYNKIYTDNNRHSVFCIPSSFPAVLCKLNIIKNFQYMQFNPKDNKTTYN